MGFGFLFFPLSLFEFPVLSFMVSYRVLGFCSSLSILPFYSSSFLPHIGTWVFFPLFHIGFWLSLLPFLFFPLQDRWRGAEEEGQKEKGRRRGAEGEGQKERGRRRRAEGEGQNQKGRRRRAEGTG